MTHPSQPRPPRVSPAAESLSELELIKIAGFVMVIACHFWVQHALPAVLGAPARVVGMGIDASTPAHIDLHAWFPTFAEHGLAYGFFNLFFGFGYQGVGVFFILTGFGLTLSALRKPTFAFWDFALGRFERVYLPYLFLLAAFSAFNAAVGGRSLVDLRAFITLDTGIPYAWFMLPLLQFYALFPLLFWLLRRGHVTPGGLLGGAVAINFVWAFAVLFLAYNVWPALAIPGTCAPKGLLPFRVAEPVLGMWLACRYHHNRAGFEAIFRPQRWPLFAALYVTGCGFSLTETNFSLGGWIVPLGQSTTNLIVAAGLFGLMFIAARAFASRTQPLQPLSRYGFEFYLVQAMPLTVAAWILPHLDLNPVTLLLLLGALLAVNLLLAMGIQQFSSWVLRHTYYRAKGRLFGKKAPSAKPVPSPEPLPNWPLLRSSSSQTPFAG